MSAGKQVIKEQRGKKIIPDDDFPGISLPRLVTFFFWCRAKMAQPGCDGEREEESNGVNTLAG